MSNPSPDNSSASPPGSSHLQRRSSGGGGARLLVLIILVASLVLLFSRSFFRMRDPGPNENPDPTQQIERNTNAAPSR